MFLSRPKRSKSAQDNLPKSIILIAETFLATSSFVPLNVEISTGFLCPLFNEKTRTPHAGQPTAHHGTSLSTEAPLRPTARIRLVPSASPPLRRVPTTPLPPPPASRRRARDSTRALSSVQERDPFFPFSLCQTNLSLSFFASFFRNYPFFSLSLSLIFVIPVSLSFSLQLVCHLRSHSNGGRFLSLRSFLSFPRYAMFRLPNTDPSRTNDRTTTPFSPLTQRTRSTSLVFLSLSHTSLGEAATRQRGAPFAKDFPDLPHLPPPSSVRVLTSRSFQKYFDVRAHVHPCT